MDALRLPIKVSSATSNFMIDAAAASADLFHTGRNRARDRGSSALGQLSARAGARLLVIVTSGKLRLASCGTACPWRGLDGARGGRRSSEGFEHDAFDVPSSDRLNNRLRGSGPWDWTRADSFWRLCAGPGAACDRAVRFVSSGIVLLICPMLGDGRVVSVQRIAISLSALVLAIIVASTFWRGLRSRRSAASLERTRTFTPPSAPRPSPRPKAAPFHRDWRLREFGRLPLSGSRYARSGVRIWRWRCARPPRDRP